MCDQVGFIQGMQGWYNICKSINVINTPHKIERDHMIISTDAGKAFDKIQHQFIIKNTQQSGTRGSTPQHNEGHV